MRLLLIRHGQTSSNVGHNLDTAQPGAPLNDLGLRQAAAIPDALEGERIAAIFASPLTRAQQTAAPLAQRLGRPVRTEAGIREIAAGQYEMRSDPDSVEAYVKTLFGWDADPQRRIPEGESGVEVLARFDHATRLAAESGSESVAFISHGGVIRVWCGLRADNIDLAYSAHHWVPNTGMVVVEGHPDEGWRMTSWPQWALGGPELSDPPHTGPAGEPEEIAESR